MDEQATEARKHLDKVLKGDEDEHSAFNFDSYEGLSESEADAVIENDAEDDDLNDLWEDPWYAEKGEE
jgi:hypothetical protein